MATSTIKTENNLVLKVNHQHRIELPSLASAGYLWEFEVGNLFVAAVEKTTNKKEKLPKESSEDLPIGNSYDECFIIYGVGKGETKITFTQSRPFEFGVPYKEYIVHVVVNE